MPEHQMTVVGGVDTHRDNHVAATIDSTGRLLGVRRSRRAAPAIATSWTGCAAGATWTVSASKAPAATGRAWRVISLLGA